MKLKTNLNRWWILLVAIFLFLSFALTLPSVSAQEGTPPIPTATPTGTPAPETEESPTTIATELTEESVFSPTVTPTAFMEVPPLQTQEAERQAVPFQALQGESSSLESIWPAFNISDTDAASIDPGIAVDSTGRIHMVWAEAEGGTKWEIYYAYWDGVRLSQSVNISQSPSFFSGDPQIALDSSGIAHIVWREEDNDYLNDSEIMYSNCSINNEGIINCEPAVSLSGPPDNWKCGFYTAGNLDISVDAPTISINNSDQIMVVWRASEPGQITQPYSVWLAGATPPLIRTGCAPMGGLVNLQRLVGHHRVMGESNKFGLTFSSLYNGVEEIYYSEFTNTSWSIPVLLSTDGGYADLFLDYGGQAHITICTSNGDLKYWNSSAQSLENIPATSCSGGSPIVVDSNGIPNVFWVESGQVYLSKNDGGWSAAQKVNQSIGGEGRPDATVGPLGRVHVIWQDTRDGVAETYYSYSYNCDGIEPATQAGKAVLQKLKGANVSSLYYCKNQVEKVIYVPGKNGEEAFVEWANLAESAENEVAFSVMYWDKRKLFGVLPVPGEQVLQGIQNLYDKVTSEASQKKYPHGMTVRILLGVQFNTIGLDSLNPRTDLRIIVLEQLRELDIPIFETLPNGSEWKVEVALYEWGQGAGIANSIHSHVKLMVVDNNKMIVSGYHPQYGFQTSDGDAKNHDLGIKVSGPIAANGMAVFDSLWDGSEILCTESDVNYSFPNECGTKPAKNPRHWIFVPSPFDNDIVLPLYRDKWNKTADEAVEIAIKSAQEQVFVIQNRFGVPGNYPPSMYEEGKWLNYANAVFNEALENTDVRILVSKEGFNYRYYNNPSVKNFMDSYMRECSYLNHPNCILKDESDLIRFYHPGNLDSDPPSLHTKSFLVDENFLVIGSQNFDHSAFGDNDEDLNLVEYSIGVENNTIISGFISEGGLNLDSIWDDSGRLFVTRQNEPLDADFQQARAGDVILVESGTYEITSTLIVPEGVTLSGFDAIIEPADNFTGQVLLKVNGNNTNLFDIIIDGSAGYGIEIGDGTTAPENINISGVVFKNNELGGIHIQSPGDGSAISYTIENNTFVGDDYGITISANANSTGVIRNNIFAGQNIAPIHIASANDGAVEYAYNLFYDCNGGDCSPNNWKTGDLGANSNEHDNLFDLNPLFANPANGDYRLTPGSPAIDAGDRGILHEFLFDGDGDGIPNLDLGAFEYVDTGSPSVQSITRNSATPTNSDSVDFTVTFSEPVENVDISDFVLTTSGVSDAFIDYIEGSEAGYTVWVNTGTGDGTIRLDISDTIDIADPTGNSLIGIPYTVGETYTIIKTIPPTPTPTPPPGNEIILDEFDGPQLDSNWEWYVPQAGPTYSLTEVPGSFQMILPAGQYYEHWVAEDYAPQLRRTDMGNEDWVIEARLEAISAAPDSGYWAALEVGFDQYDQLWFGMVDDGNLRNFSIGNLSTSFENPESLPVTLRLEKDGENYTFLYKSDGDADWTFLSTQSYSRIPTYVGLIGRSWETGSSDLKMDWSYFKLERIDTPDPGPQDVVVTVLNTSNVPQEGLNTYVFNGADYTGIHGQTDENGQVTFILPTGDYRFRTDLNGTQFWSDDTNHCHVPDCQYAEITVSEPVTVTVRNSNDEPQPGIKVYAFDEATYTGYNLTTNGTGEAVFTLPIGSYRFRADLNGTQFWSSTNNQCHLPDCDNIEITITIPFVVTVRNTDDLPQAGLKVYAFDDTTYTGYNLTTNDNGEAVFTLPFGSYRFRADLNGTQFWSGTSNHCLLPGCSNVNIQVTKPTVVSVLNTDDVPQEGLRVYAFDGTSYTGYNTLTNSNGQASFTLPVGSYRFRADLNGTQFWSGASNHCDIPDCGNSQITVTIPITVTVQDTDGAEKEGVTVYAFNGTTYVGYSKSTNASGQAVFTLPAGTYRFRADFNGTQFWSGTVNHCSLPGCSSVQVTVTNGLLVSVLDTDGLPRPGLKVYAFNGSTYTGFNSTTNANGQVTFTLPEGSYRFRADLNGTQFWSGGSNHCDVPGCGSANITVTKPIVVNVSNTDNAPQAGLKVYAFNGSTYIGYNATTNASGQVTFTLPLGSYRFRADLNGTQFWSGSSNHCDIPGCESVAIQVTKPITVTVLNTDNAPQAGLKVYAFNGTTYTGYTATTNASGQVTFTLPQGNYRFRADLNGTQFWSGSSNHCTLPGCDTVGMTVTIPVTVTVQDGNGLPKSGTKVYAFNGTTYTGYNQVTNHNGQVVFTLPVGNYRFRADYNNVQFWSEIANHCTLPGCTSANVITAQ